jgi:Flp pilus assembly protein TadD
LTWIREQPLAAGRLFVRKLAFTFHAAHVALPHSYPYFAYDTPGILRFFAVGPWLLIPLGLVGLAIGVVRAHRGTSGAFLVWAAFVPAYAASVALFFVAERYRFPLLVPLCVGAGAAIDFAWKALTVRDTKTLAFLGAGLTALFAAVNVRTGLDDGRWTEGLRTAERYVILGHYDEVDRWATWLESRTPPRPGAGLFGVGRQMLALGQFERALPYLTRAHAANPSDAPTEYALGQALAATGRTREAVEHLRAGFESGILLTDAGEGYARALIEGGDLAGAAAVLRRVKPADSAPADVWLRLGRLGMEARAPDAAEPFFRRAAELQPADAPTRLQYGLNLLVQKRFADAARELDEAAGLEAHNPDTLSHLAYAEFELGRRDDARRHAHAALVLNPGDPLALQLVAMLR